MSALRQEVGVKEVFYTIHDDENTFGGCYSGRKPPFDCLDRSSDSNGFTFTEHVYVVRGTTVRRSVWSRNTESLVARDRRTLASLAQQGQPFEPPDARSYLYKSSKPSLQQQ